MDIGTGVNAIALPEAKDALVFMIVSLHGHWKVPCGYFFPEGTSSETKANLVRLCLTRTHEAGAQVYCSSPYFFENHIILILPFPLLKVMALTFDGTSTNFSMARLLGAQVSSSSSLSTSFRHPVEGEQEVHIILDACHMLKLMRNCLGDKRVLLGLDGQVRRY